MKILSEQVTRHYGPFKLMKGENCATTFLPLNMKIGGPITHVKDKEATCLTKEQAKHIYKKVDSEGIVNINTSKQEIEEDKVSSKNTDEKINPYPKIVVNNVFKEIPMHHKGNSGL